MAPSTTPTKTSPVDKNHAPDQHPTTTLQTDRRPSWRRHGAALSSALLDLLLPPRCLSCTTIVPPDTPFCPLCEHAVHPVTAPCRRCGLPDAAPLCPECERLAPPYRAALAPLVHGGQAAVAVNRLKYGGQTHLAAGLSRLLAQAAPSTQSVDLLLPVPLHRRRLRSRGYNQAALLALDLGRRVAIPVQFNALRRVRHTPRQVRLNRDQRLENLHRAFVALPNKVANARLLLVDDVMTTGATATACSRALLAAGARSVQVLTVTRAVPARPQTNTPRSGW